VPVYREPGSPVAVVLGGAHRLAVAVALGYDTVPCELLSRDEAEGGAAKDTRRGSSSTNGTRRVAGRALVVQPILATIPYSRCSRPRNLASLASSASVSMIGMGGRFSACQCQSLPSFQPAYCPSLSKICTFSPSFRFVSA
jgi:hypothetical protein